MIKLKDILNEAVDIKDGKYRFYSKDGVGYLTYDGKELASGDFDWEDGSNSYWMSHSSFKGSQKAFDTGKDVIKYFKSKKITTESVNEATTSWSRMMQSVRKGGSGPWSLVGIENKKVVAQKINIKDKNLLPAHFEAMRKEHPRAKIHIEDAGGQVVWNEKR
jgi:hypothetical protein